MDALTQVILPHRNEVQIEGASLTEKYLLVNERANASTRMFVHRLDANGSMPTEPLGQGEAITFDEEVYTLSGGGSAPVLTASIGWLVFAAECYPAVKQCIYCP